MKNIIRRKFLKTVATGSLLAALPLRTALRNTFFETSKQSKDEWKAIKHSNGMVIKGSALDFSYFVEEGPAGKYGRVIIGKEGGFTFEKRPDQRVYFLGCSISPGAELKNRTDAEIEAYAENIRTQGYNLVRPHFLDSALSDEAKADLEFDPEFLDRFDYFVSCLKKRGIYLYIDAMTSWKGYLKIKTWTDEGKEVNFKQRIYFEGEVRKHWENGVKKLLTHLNPYTNTKLIDDPVVAVILFFNEQNLNLFRSVPTILNKPWREYLRKKYGTLDALNKSWVNENGGSLLDTSITWETIPLFTPSTFREKTQRGIDFGAFMISIDTELTLWFIERIRSMGYKGLVTHCDWLQNFGYSVARNEVDVISMHGYFAHPGNMDLAGSKILQTSSLEDEIGWWRGMAGTRFLDRPFAITEYGHVYWNKHRYEEGLVIGGYCAFQDHDLIMAHAGPVSSRTSLGTIRPFSIGNDPVGRASQVVSSLIFKRHDVSPAAHTVHLEIRPEELFTKDNITGALPRDQSRIQLVTRLGITYTGSKPPAGIAKVKSDVTLRVSGSAKVVSTDWVSSVVDGPDGKFNASNFFASLREKKLLPESNRTDVEKGLFETENGQLLLDSKNRTLILQTPRAEGVCDALFSNPHYFKALTVLSSSRAAQVTALSLDGKQLAESRRILLVYATDALNSNAIFENDDRTIFRNRGTLPLVMLCGTLSISLKNQKAQKLSIWALDLDGTRREKIIPAKTSGDEITINIDTSALADGPTPFFEITDK